MRRKCRPGEGVSPTVGSEGALDNAVRISVGKGSCILLFLQFLFDNPAFD